jgi:hypothetical protein
MKSLWTAIALAVILIPLLTADVGHTAAPATQSATALGDIFPITAWELPFRKKRELLADPKCGIASMAECGFTVAAFPLPEQLELVQKAGLQAIVGPRDAQVKWNELSDDAIIETVKKMIEESKDNPMVMGYFLRDEPGVGEFPALAKAVAAVKSLAPGKLAYINLFPNYATLGAPNLSQLGTATYTEYLERYVHEVKPQFLSYDNYKVQISDDLTNAAQSASYFQNLLEVRRVALEHDLPFWNIVASNQIRPQTTIPSPANLLVQAYTSLAAGAKGLTWFTYYTGGYHDGPIDNARHRTLTWSYLKMMNDQVKALGPVMLSLRSTGVWFTSPPSSQLTSQPATSQPTGHGNLIASVESSPAAPAMIGEFAGPQGAQYVMIVNLSLARSANFTVKAAAPVAGYMRTSPVDGSTSPLERETSIWLAAGQGALLQLMH